MPQARRLIRVFVGSPGDVAMERQAAIDTIASLGNTGLIAPSWQVEPVAWDRTLYSRNFWLAPQKAISDNLPRPADCEIAVYMFWGRIGTELAESAYDQDLRSATGLENVPLTGSTWELCDALHAAAAGNGPRILLFSCRRPFPRVGRERLDEQRAQQDAVDALFDTFKDSGGRFLRDVLSYESVEEFTEVLGQQLGVNVREIIDENSQQRRELDEPIKNVSTTPMVSPEYRQWLIRETGSLSLLGLNAQEAYPARLDQVYVTALTRKRQAPTPEYPQLRGAGFDSTERQHYSHLIDALDAESLCISGSAGSGKSLFCRWVVMLLALNEIPRHAVEAPEGLQERFPEQLRGMLPVLVRLRDLTARHRWAAGTQNWHTDDLYGALGGWLEREKPQGLDRDSFLAHLERGRVMLALDGFDEVPHELQVDGGIAYPRAALLRGLADALPNWTAQGHRVMLTTRPYGIQPPELRALAIGGARIRRLPVELQELFLKRWYRTVDPSHADELVAGLLDKLAQQPAIFREIRRNPMMLTALAVKYREGRQLPTDIDHLYDALTSYILHNRYSASPLSVDMARRSLGVIALRMHTGRYVDESDPKLNEVALAQPMTEISYGELEKLLHRFTVHSEGDTSPASAHRTTLRNMQELLSKAGIFAPSGDNHAAFYHLNIQDFLAAEQLYRIDASCSWWLQRFAEEPRWHPTFMFWFLKIRSNNTPARALKALAPLIDMLERRCLAVHPNATDLLGGCLELALAHGFGGSLIEPFRAACLEALPQLGDLQVRAQLLRRLGRMECDDRPGVGLDDSARPDISWVPVAPGDVVLEDGQGSVHVGSFAIARYPVTWIQFQRFVEAGDGYLDPRWWQEVDPADRTSAPVPARWPSPNNPRENVSWFEAMAFCRWLSSFSEREVRLPTEEQWQLAASGYSQRAYPWGDVYERDKANCNQLEEDPAAVYFERTTPVGVYPDGATDTGIQDLAGNVLEWTATGCDADDRVSRNPNGAHRVLRGGSWFNRPRSTRNGYRVGTRPALRSHFVGFRVVTHS